MFSALLFRAILVTLIHDAATRMYTALGPPIPIQDQFVLYTALELLIDYVPVRLL